MLPTRRQEEYHAITIPHLYLTAASTCEAARWYRGWQTRELLLHWPVSPAEVQSQEAQGAGRHHQAAITCRQCCHLRWRAAAAPNRLLLIFKFLLLGDVCESFKFSKYMLVKNKYPSHRNTRLTNLWIAIIRSYFFQLLNEQQKTINIIIFFFQMKFALTIQRHIIISN